MRLTGLDDGYGRLLLDYLESGSGIEIVERDDGYIDATAGPKFYFEPFAKWPKVERKAIRRARGRALDVGCGAGRVALHLQDRGLEVVGIDVSPGAVEVSRRRGVKDARELAVTRVDRSLGRFDTIVMFGNNFGLFGSAPRARWLLRRFHSLTNEGARILGESRDPYKTDAPEHLSYQRRNRSRGRMSGELRIRVRHRLSRTPWFDYLIVSPEEMAELVDGTGWELGEVIDGGEDVYVGVIERR